MTTKGRIGVGRRIHRIAETSKLSTGELWGLAWCGWCGLCEPVVTEEVSCRKCIE